MSILNKLPGSLAKASVIVIISVKNLRTVLSLDIESDMATVCVDILLSSFLVVDNDSDITVVSNRDLIAFSFLPIASDTASDCNVIFGFDIRRKVSDIATVSDRNFCTNLCPVCRTSVIEVMSVIILPTRLRIESDIDIDCAAIFGIIFLSKDSDITAVWDNGRITLLRIDSEIAMISDR